MPVLLHPSSFPNVATLSAGIQHGVLWEIHDNFQKQTYRNRYHICTDRGLHKLIIPIRHVGGAYGRQTYRDVRVDNTYSWQKQHWRTLQTAYRTSPFFEFYEDALAPLFEKQFIFLIDFNWESIRFLWESMGISLTTAKTTGYATTVNQAVEGRFLVNAKTNLHFEQAPYIQVFGDRHGFIKNTSTLDLLFNEGGNALTYLKRQHLSFLDE